MSYARFAVAAVMLVGCAGDDGQCLQYGRPDIASLEYRDPQTGQCQSFGGYDCADPCRPCPATGEAQPDWAMCYGPCEGLAEAACKTTTACRAVYAGNSFYECWGVAQSGPVQGGGCSGLDAQTCSRHDDCIARHAVGSPIGDFVSCEDESAIQDPGSCVGAITCTTPQPQCPTGTIAGRRNGCWTGYCIPYEQCDQLPACSTLGESDCIMRTDCAPTYEGINCTCTMNGCTCQSWVFDSCKMR
jgi:hypothetical protein